MNFMDYCFIAVLILSGLAGMYQGLVRSVVGFASMFFTFYISFTFYPSVARTIKESTPIYKALKDATSRTLSNGISSVPGMDKLTSLNDTILNSLVEKISAPPVLRRLILNQIHIDINNINTSQIIDTLSTKSADIFVNIMSIVILFAAIQFLFTIIQNGLGMFFTLPILSELNIIGGFAFGAIQGIVTLFVICAAWSMLSGASMYREVFVDLNASQYAKWFYENNLLLDFLVKHKII